MDSLRILLVLAALMIGLSGCSEQDPCDQARADAAHHYQVWSSKTGAKDTPFRYMLAVLENRSCFAADEVERAERIAPMWDKKRLGSGN